MLTPHSLDSRRPRFLRELVGSAHVVSRLTQQMKSGTVPERVFLCGPTGSGKTTVAQVLVRHFFCRDRIGIGDPCGQCDRCRVGLEYLNDYEEWTGARLDASWDWWESYGASILRRPWASIFIDEAQDLSDKHQKSLLRDLEGATCQVIFATTHRHYINDALIKRFGNNVYEMRRPTVSEVADYMTLLCQSLGVRASTTELERVAKLNGCDLRLCVDFAHIAAVQAPDRVVTPSFVDAVFGLTPEVDGLVHPNPSSRVKL